MFGIVGCILFGGVGASIIGACVLHQVSPKENIFRGGIIVFAAGLIMFLLDQFVF